MNARERQALDRHITGNYGEDQFKGQPDGEESGLCPICGQHITLTGGVTTNSRLIGSCGDAFTLAQWTEQGEEEYDEPTYGGPSDDNPARLRGIG